MQMTKRIVLLLGVVPMIYYLLAGFFSPIPQSVSIKSQVTSYSGQKSRCYRDDRFPNPMPRRFFAALLCVAITPFLVFRGLKYIVDDNRRFLGRLLIASAFIVSFSGLGLLWLTGFRGTWGWIF